MGQVIKALLFQMKRDLVIYIVFAAVLVIQLGFVFQASGLSTVSGGEFFAISISGIMTLSVTFAEVFTGEVCCSDFRDKTFNYELLCGHSRRASYTARAAVSLVGGTLGALVTALVPVLAYTAINGWGSDISAGDAALRLGLMIFPTVRIVCEFVFLSFVVKNKYAVMLCAYLLMIISSSESLPPSVVLGHSNISALGIFDAWFTYGLDGTENVIYSPAPSSSLVWGTIAASVLFGALFMTLGYVFFKNDDLV